MTARRGLIWLHTFVQVAFGVVGFAVAPAAMFAGMDADPLAALCLRLAAYTNVALAGLVATLMWRDTDVGTTRRIAAALASYHVLASVDGLALALGWTPVQMASGAPPPIYMHAAFALALAAAAAVPPRPAV